MLSQLTRIAISIVSRAILKKHPQVNFSKTIGLAGLQRTSGEIFEKLMCLCYFVLHEKLRYFQLIVHIKSKGMSNKCNSVPKKDISIQITITFFLYSVYLETALLPTLSESKNFFMYIIKIEMK